MSDNSVDSKNSQPREKIGLIIRSIKTNESNEQKGWQLKTGQFVKFAKSLFRVTVIHQGQTES